MNGMLFSYDGIKKDDKEAETIEKTSHSISSHSASIDIMDQSAWTYEVNAPFYYFAYFIHCDFSIY